jgi:hypothetical protein
MQCHMALCQGRMNADNQIPLNRSFILPLRLTVEEFATICRTCNETIRRDIRSRKIKAQGKPYLIASRELLKYDVNPQDVTEEHFYGQVAA